MVKSEVSLYVFRSKFLVNLGNIMVIMLYWVENIIFIYELVI